MAITTFNGTLRSNEIMASIFNMIISQQVFANNLGDSYGSLVDSARVDGTLYGDTKLYYSTDCLGSVDWLNDAEAKNLLDIDRPSDPQCQKITIDKFRQIRLTLDNYLSKRAWGTEGAFSQFSSVMQGWIKSTKKVYDTTIYNSYIGTCVGDAVKNSVAIKLSDITATGEEKNRLRAQTIANKLADLLADMKDFSRDYNSYGFLRSYDKGELKLVFNAKYANEITKLDLPTIYHNELLKMDNVLPSRYFGTVNSSAGKTGTTNTTIRSLIEKDYNTVKRDATGYDPKKHVFPGDLLPVSTDYGADETYTQDDKVICKIMGNQSVPFMSAFEVGTSFFNPRSLTENHYLTWGHNTLQYLYEFPMIKVYEN